MKIAIRLSCVVAAALAAGSATADNGLSDFPGPLDGVVDGPAGLPFDDGWQFDEYAVDGDPTGGAVFYETLGGDAMAIAQTFGFDVIEVYEGSCVAEPTDGVGLWDAYFLCSILNGADSCAGAELDEFLRDPEGSGFAGGVLGSWFGRAQYLGQLSERPVSTIHGVKAHEFATGAGVTVAVLDSGIDASHPLFNDPAGRVLPGRDFVDLDDDPSEVAGGGYGHGTTVAGLVLLAAPDAHILPIRVLDAGGVGTAGRIAAGIRHAADAGAGVINMSFGGKGRSSTVHDAIVDAVGRGVVLVAAAGNVVRGDPNQFPANDPDVIAATGSVGRRGEVWAPSTRLAGPYPQERWFRGRGTSFSCALVSGGVALAKQRHPAVTKPEIVTALVPRPNGVPRLDLKRLAHVGDADAVGLFFTERVR